MGSLTHGAALHEHLGAGELGRAPSRDGSVRWPVPAGFSWGLASAALVMAITTAVIAVADGDVFIITLVPGSIGLAVLPRRPYEIDVRPDRAVLYLLLGAVVPVAYLAVVAASRGVLGVNRSLAVQVPAAAAAALWPARDRPQRRVDHLFDGDRSGRYDARADLAAMLEQERRRLRRDLHDGLGPTLAGLTLGLDTARTLSPGLPDLQELLDRLKAETQRAVTDVHRLVYGLRPPALDELGLVGSLREQIGRLRGQAPALQVSLEVPGEGLANLPAAVEVACYRIVTEALTNVARHARATRCLVRIRLGHGLDVEVCDDGVGLPEGWRAGVGVASMRERAAELGGDLVIEPGLPHGTRIAVRLPVREGP